MGTASYSFNEMVTQDFLFSLVYFYYIFLQHPHKAYQHLPGAEYFHLGDRYPVAYHRVSLQFYLQQQMFA